MKKIFIILIALFISTIAYSQPQMPADGGIIVGMVVDNQNQPIAYSNIFLFKSTDSVAIDAVATDQSGKFIFQNVKFGSYYIELKLIGFQKKRINNIELTQQKRFVKIGQISILQEEQQLGEVVVTAQNTNVQYQLDKKIVNVGQDIASSGGNATDALRNVPGINVDFDGNVTLRGSSNFIVMIDGKPSILEPNEALKQIPASNIEKIDIITNPSAKYDPDGDAGIINIITRQKSNDGLSGKIELGIDTYLAKKADITINYKKNKLTLMTQFIYNENIRSATGTQYRETYLPNYTQILENTQDIKHIHGNISGKFGVQYNISSKDNLNINFTASERRFGDQNKAIQHLYTNNNFYNLYFLNVSNASVKGLNVGGDVNYEHKFDDKGHKIKTFAQVSLWQPERLNFQSIDTTDQYWNKISSYIYQDRTVENIINKQFRFQTDYELPLKNNSKFEAGIALKYNDFSSKYRQENYINSTWQEEPIFSNNFTLDFMIGSAYMTYSNKLWNLFNYQIGLRSEYTYRLAYEHNTDTSYLYNKINVYPTIHLSKKLPNDQQLQASYSLRVNRPNNRNLNPFPMRMNQFTYRQGNPALEPEFAHSFELNYIKNFGKSSVSLETFYRQTNNKIDRRMIIKDTLIYMFSDNLNKDYSYGGELMLNLMILKFINFNLSGSVYQYYLNGILEGQNIEKKQFMWNTRANIMTMLPTKTVLQIGGFYNAPFISIDGKMKPMFVTFAGIRQSFFKQKLQISLSIQDLLGTMKFGGESQTEKYKTNFEMKPQSPNIGFTVTYRINNFKQDRSQHQENGNGDEVDFGGEGMY